MLCSFQELRDFVDAADVQDADPDPADWRAAAGEAGSPRETLSMLDPDLPHEGRTHRSTPIRFSMFLMSRRMSGNLRMSDFQVSTWAPTTKGKIEIT